jgi:hypothetical protein
VDHHGGACERVKCVGKRADWFQSAWERVDHHGGAWERVDHHGGAWERVKRVANGQILLVARGSLDGGDLFGSGLGASDLSFGEERSTRATPE